MKQQKKSVDNVSTNLSELEKENEMLRTTLDKVLALYQNEIQILQRTGAQMVTISTQRASQIAEIIKPLAMKEMQKNVK